MTAEGGGEKLFRLAVARPAAYTEPAGMPLGFAALPPLTPKGVALSFYDGHAAALPQSFEEEALALLVDGACPGPAKRLADAARLAGKPVLLMGRWPSRCPEEAKRYADTVLCGPPEARWAVAVEDLAEGRPEPYYRAGQGAPPRPRYDYGIFTRRAYPLGAARLAAGCEGLGRRAVFLEDEGLFEGLGPEEALPAGLPLPGRAWGCRLAPDPAAALAARLKEAGCVLVELCPPPGAGAQDAGPWTGYASAEDFAAALRAVRGAGLMASAVFIVAAPEAGALEEITRLARRHRLAALSLWPLEGQAAGAPGEAARLARACRAAEAAFYAGGGVLWRWLADAANRRHPGVYFAMARAGRRRAEGEI